MRPIESQPGIFMVFPVLMNPTLIHCLKKVISHPLVLLKTIGEGTFQGADYLNAHDFSIPLPMGWGYIGNERI